jgi:hypothetical protein
MLVGISMVVHDKGIIQCEFDGYITRGFPDRCV